MDASKVNIPSNIDLADKDFGIPGEIDMLIGNFKVYQIKWDEPLSNPIAKEWNDFQVSTLPVIQNIHDPRLVIGKGRIIIHRIADASTAAYGTVRYA
ncbi:hypothetical protein TNCV_1185911 [Trichonephila clavipes]|nr:hypothetical protein TNCV_1185911 [Trichonephila clavipes]